MSVDTLLFALARDAKLNVDIHPKLTGTVTLNAVNQTLPQLLERIAKQVDLRYQFDGTLLTISPDLPYMRLYKIGYVNLSRKTSGEVSVATEIARTGSGIYQGTDLGGNISTTKITNESTHQFWESLKKNILTILAGNKDDVLEDKVIINPESGVMTVRATQKQHQEIQSFVDQVLGEVQRQVLIEATIAEVRLNDQYQTGIDWKRIVGHYTYTQSMTGAHFAKSPVFSMTYSESDSRFGNLSATVRLLEQFGTVKVLSSPKIMALNNQTAILKVVDNIVYFTTEVEINETETKTRETFTTEINTVPVGLVMSVTPQISENGVVILNIRPTISRIIDFKQDPNPTLADAGMVNLIPEIQVREIETVLKVNNGEMVIIGGLMEDSTHKNTQGVPFLSKLPLIGDLFSYRDDKYTQTELVIFLRPIVVKDANLSGDLREYRVFLPEP
ncbi:type II and III secretion system protein [Candidatus Thiomargarita nelsonii]|uniref:Type II and III secretion system protein n=1 Tax=Candidatus Thiomargarita nelsonii TaxID=1003181 RepID=A0A176S6E0_9GAMM|nr:type II and III secretion system protein [Candidatus Thiomargarita nelsonii]